MGRKWDILRLENDEKALECNNAFFLNIGGQHAVSPHCEGQEDPSALIMGENYSST